MAKLTRRDWIKAFGGLVPLTTFVACQKAGLQQPLDGPSGPDAPAGCAMSDASTVIMNNHPHGLHVLTVPMADVQATPMDRMYHIMGMASHDHVVTITAAQFQMLQAGGTVEDTSTMTFCHTHVCQVSCG